MNRAALSDRRFGRLTVIRLLESRDGHIVWLCRCDCGKERKATTGKLNSGGAVSCGCGRSGPRGAAGEARRTREYRTWAAMRARCNNPNTINYDRYGGRGITVCERWSSYEVFLADMGRCPSPEHSIDRIDNSGNYEPTNCRWATRVEQASNKRPRVRITAHA